MGEGEQMAQRLGLTYVPISTKTNFNVTTLFESLAERVLGARAQESEVAAAAAPAATDKKDKKEKKEKDDDDDKEKLNAPLKVDMKNPPPKKAEKKKSGGGCDAV